MTVVPLGTILVFKGDDGSRIDLLSMSTVTVEPEFVVDVLVPPDAGKLERGTVEVPTAAGLLHLPARLHREDGRLHVRLPHSIQAIQRRLTPRYGLSLPLRGSATFGSSPGGVPDAANRITFQGYTVDVGAGGLQARLTGDVGIRLPQHLHGVFVELDPGDPHSVAVVLTVVTLRSDMLRAQFSFISMADWVRLRDRVRNQA
ncbi:MAG: hypothetical protein HYR62_05395 [Actinobacteria bacterium]|nr:hypothetical protein [Actinomycetota bacterium]MBI3688476.1 hypothetical protein [Actinomycetota bacterium]